MVEEILLSQGTVACINHPYLLNSNLYISMPKTLLYHCVHQENNVPPHSMIQYYHIYLVNYISIDKTNWMFPKIMALQPNNNSLLSPLMERTHERWIAFNHYSIHTESGQYLYPFLWCRVVLNPKETIRVPILTMPIIVMFISLSGTTGSTIIRKSVCCLLFSAHLHLYSPAHKWIGKDHWMHCFQRTTDDDDDDDRSTWQGKSFPSHFYFCPLEGVGMEY